MCVCTFFLMALYYFFFYLDQCFLNNFLNQLVFFIVDLHASQANFHRRDSGIPSTRKNYSEVPHNAIKTALGFKVKPVIPTSSATGQLLLLVLTLFAILERKTLVLANKIIFVHRQSLFTLSTYTYPWGLSKSFAVSPVHRSMQQIMSAPITNQ